MIFDVLLFSCRKRSDMARLHIHIEAKFIWDTRNGILVYPNIGTKFEKALLGGLARVSAISFLFCLWK